MYIHGLMRNVEMPMKANKKIPYIDDKGKTNAEGPKGFIDFPLLSYRQWARSWHINHNSDKDLVFWYEDFLARSYVELTRDARNFKLDTIPKKYNAVVRNMRFQQLSDMCQREQESVRNSFRTGISRYRINRLNSDLIEIHN